MSLLTRSFFFRAERRGELKSKKKEQLKSVTLYYCNFRSKNDLETLWCYGYEYLFFICTMEYSTTKFIHQQTIYHIIVVGIICSPVPAALTALDTRVLTPSVDRESRAEWRAWSPKCFRSSRKLPRTPLSKKHMQNTPRYLNICV